MFDAGTVMEAVAVAVMVEVGLSLFAYFYRAVFRSCPRTSLAETYGKRLGRNVVWHGGHQLIRSRGPLAFIVFILFYFFF